MTEWILVVDDDASNLRMASHILSGESMRVSCLKSGEDALAFLAGNVPDLILLDVHMTGIDGFETLEKIRANKALADIPVIFLTADEDTGTETKSLRSGAMDFIKKPFVPDVLLLRVRHTLDLTRLQSNLTREVERKTAEVVQQNRRVEQMAQQIVKALAGAIDAKDTYTNGHSSRVAFYAREIAKRAGFSDMDQENIYMMGLLHDVGKIGVSDSIINKPAKLTEEEYAQIMNHPVLGAQILKNISEFPELVTGARWHHERFDGLGYPDRLSGELIPVEARIIGVADAYDAMTSRRSYRGVMPQERVRSEIELGKGTQFDPQFAEIMLTMIEEDSMYNLREDPDGR
ncbi:MAG: response regulator [Lachnospiraceae bacterium]|nr:response regulator [Lachnospiraceae bacterium]